MAKPAKLDNRTELRIREDIYAEFMDDLEMLSPDERKEVYLFGPHDIIDDLTIPYKARIHVWFMVSALAQRGETITLRSLAQYGRKTGWYKTERTIKKHLAPLIERGLIYARKEERT